jgi:hypothetical protein
VCLFESKTIKFFSKVGINSFFAVRYFFSEVNGIVMIIGLLYCMFREDFYCLAYLIFFLVLSKVGSSVIVENEIINLCTYLSLKTFYGSRGTDRCSNSYSFTKQGRTNSKNDKILQFSTLLSTIPFY